MVSTLLHCGNTYTFTSSQSDNHLQFRMLLTRVNNEVVWWLDTHTVHYAHNISLQWRYANTDE